MFKLLRYFSLASASVMIVAVIIFAMVFRQHEIDNLTESAETQNVSLARSFANVIWTDVSPYLETVSKIDGTTLDRAALRARPEIQKINEQLKKIAAGLPITKVKIYNLNGIVIFSSEFSQIGDDKSTNAGFLSAAREEKPASILTFRDTFSAFEGRILDRNLIASYLPVYSPDNSLDGVFELYMDVSPLIKRINETTVRLVVILTVFFLMLYGILFLIVRRADIILKKQHINLTESQHELEKRVAERTKDLSKSEERFSLAMRGTNDGLWDWNLKTNYVYFSPRLCQMQGFGQEELEPVLDTWASLVDPNDKERVLKKVQEYISGDADSFETEFRMRHKDGSWVSILSRAFLVHENGEAVRLVGTHVDITQRKNIELREHQARVQAETASQAKSNLMANMSHELRTPLNAIIGFSSTMQEEVFGPIGNDKYREYLSDINHSGQHLLDLINDILDVSAIEEGALELSETEVNMADVAEGAIRLIASRAEHRKVKISTFLGPKTPLILADERRVRQVIINLLSNAVKFTPEGGEVIVDSLLNDDGSFSVHVSDTGFGMSDNEVDIAMTRFGQVDSGHDRKHEGTGLGLPLTKGLMELHGGILEIDSLEGYGTMVTATFPKERIISNVS